MVKSMRVAVLAGGRSSEREVSLRSACSVLDGLVDGGHEVEPIVIGSDGLWRCIDPRSDSQDTASPVAIVPGGGSSAILHVDEERDGNGEIDVVFPVLHGPYGEDGTVQGLLECVDIPYVGAGVLASALCMDKATFKAHIANAGIEQPRYLAISDGEWQVNPNEVKERIEVLGLPLFVKPSCLGSSVGISRVAAHDELSKSIEAAFAHDSKVLVEEAINGREVECSVIGNAEPIASLPGEIRTTTDWYDFEAKYEPGGMDLVVPVELPRDVFEEVREIAVKVFRISGCEGLARVDFFVTDEDKILVSELNTIPGFTTTSVFSRLFEATGVSYVDLLDRLLEYALERHRQQQQYVY